MSDSAPEASRVAVVRIRRRHRFVRPDGMIVEIDPRLARTALGRTVYHARSDRYLSEPHEHAEPHILLCLAGLVRVGVQEPGASRPAWHALAQGDVMRVAGRLPHRLWMGAGSVLAAASPAVSWLVAPGSAQIAAGVQAPAGQGWDAR